MRGGRSRNTSCSGDDRQHIKDVAFAAAATFVFAVLIPVAPVQGENLVELSSSSIAAGQMQKPHACCGKGGTDQPLQLTIRGVPADAKFISIVADDPDAVKPQVVRGRNDDELVAMATDHVNRDHPELVGKLSRQDILGMAEEDHVTTEDITRPEQR